METHRVHWWKKNPDFANIKMLKTYLSPSLKHDPDEADLRRGIGAALRRVADRRVRVVHAVLHARPLVDFHVGDGKDALPIGAGDFPLVPVLIHSADQRDPLALQNHQVGSERFCFSNVISSTDR